MKLRVKFFLFLVGLPSLALLIFIFIAFRVMVQDKTLYILESNMSMASVLGRQIDQEDWKNSEGALKHMPLVKGVVFNPKGQILIATNPKFLNQKIGDFIPNSALEKLSDVRFEEGSFEDKDLENKEAIYNYIRLPTKDAMLLLMTPKASALRASLIFLVKAVATFFLLISIAVGASWWLSRSMTQPLEVLRNCMKNFADGDFKIKIPHLGLDEIGQLGGYFNQMVKQITELIKDRETKLKIEVEMSLASEIQKNLLPKESFSSPEIEFSGFYEAASNCGGDWWFYFQTGNTFVVCIGDVTGHGVHSALLTSASRAAFTGIARNFNTVEDAMGLLNQSIYDTAQGTLNMTCIIAAIDLTTGELGYTNASHEAPVVMPAKDGQVTKKEFVFLDETHGPRLGEAEGTVYRSSKLKLDPQQHLFFYTDGVTDLRDNNKVPLGDRKLLKILGESYKASRSADQEKVLFAKKLREYRLEQTLEDDVSFFFLKWSSYAKTS